MHYDLELKQKHIAGEGKVVPSSDTAEDKWVGLKDFPVDVV